MEVYDLIVIGGGPAGYLAAERAAQAGLRVMLFEKESLGGACLNVGCVPSKTLLNTAKIFNHAKEGECFGVQAKDVSINHTKVVERKCKVVRTLVSGVTMTLKKLGVQVVKSAAYIEGKESDGFVVSADKTRYAAKYLIVAAGSVPTIPPIKGLREGIEAGFAVTNETVFDLPEVPRNLVVLGGGVIGMEMASYFKAAGSNVTVVEMLNSIGGNFGVQMSRTLQEDYESKGFVFHLGCHVSEVGDRQVQYTDPDGKVWDLPADKVLVSLGRRANLTGLGLENLNVLTGKSGVIVDDRMETSVPGVYAPGDINGKMTLAHVAYREAEVAVNNILGKHDRMDYRSVPSILYTDPEIACVGETPESAREKGYDVKVVTLPMQYSGRYVAETENGKGTCTVVYDKKNDRLLGMQVCATGSSEFIYGVGAFLDMEISLERLKKIIFPHPTVGEIVRESIFEL